MDLLRLWIDTDIGDDIDDAIALAYALNSPAFTVEGVSTVGYGGRDRAGLVRAVAEASNKSVPVYIGRETVSTGFPVTRPSGQRQWAAQHGPDVSDVGTDFAEALYETALRYDGELYLVTMGPLTNIAEAFKRYPDLPGRLAGVYVMGGEIHVFRREHNFAADYAAADAVLRHAHVPRLATWSIGQQLIWDDEALTRLGRSPSPVAKLLKELIDAWNYGYPVLYDVVPLVWLENADLVDFRTMEARVETVGLYTRGVLVDMATHATGLELRACSAPFVAVEDGSLAHVTTGVNRDAVERLLANRLFTEGEIKQ